MKRCILSFLCFLLLTFTLTAQQTLLPYKSSWKFFTGAADPGTAWHLSPFDDAFWSSGSGKLGYGLEGLSTLLRSGTAPLYTTTYFRTTLTLSNPEQFDDFTGNVQFGDGVVVYINGVEVYRKNLPAGTLTSLTPATTAGTFTKKFPISKGVFVPGTNVVAVAVHQQAESLSDMVFDMKLSAYPDVLPPRVLNADLLPPGDAQPRGSALTYRFRFSEKVSGVDVTDFVLTPTSGAPGGTVSQVTQVDGSGTLSDVAVSAITGTGTFRLDLKSGGTAITDMVGNTSVAGFTSGPAYIVDQTPPFVKSITRLSPLMELTKASTVTFQVAFSEKVTGVGRTDFSVVAASGTVKGEIESGDVDPVGTDGTTYNVKVSSISGSGLLRLDLKASATGIGDAAKNACDGYSAGQTFHIDKTPPQVLGIGRQAPAAPLTNAAALVYRVSFTEPVAGVDAADFSLTTLSGTVKGVLSPDAVQPVGPEGTTWDVRVSALSGSGELRLGVKSSGTGIVDGAGSKLSGGFAGGESYTLDVQAPTVVSITRQLPSRSTTNAPSLTYRVAFSEPVTGLKGSDFSLVTLSGTTTAAVASDGVVPAGTDGTTWDVMVTRVSGAGILRLDVRSSSTGIMDVLGNPLTSGFATGQAYTIDYTAPEVVSINRHSPDEKDTEKSSVIFRVSFSEAVTGVDATDFLLTALEGTASGELAAESVVPANSSGSRYDVEVRSITKNVQLRLDISSSTGITDGAGNSLAGGYTAGQSYNIHPPIPYGFESVTPLHTQSVTATTEHKPQGKLWTHDGHWWSVLATSDGTKIFRLDGTSWTDVLTLSSAEDAKADCWVVEDVTHILLFRESSSSQLVSVEYDAAQHTYKLWSRRPSRVSLSLGSDAEVATLVVDDRGRMWIAADGDGDVSVRWSDAPYTSWSSRIKLASGATDDDICTLAKLPGKIGVLWSNQDSERFGFRTHSDGDDPDDWAEDEKPGATSAKNVGAGFSDDHMNIVSGSDGTLYCAVKTSYDTDNYPKESLLVRRPDGTWDKLYTVTENENHGTRGIVLVNEQTGKLRVVYTSIEDGGDILYRESALYPISFGPARTLLHGQYNHATSTHQAFTSEVVVLVTDLEEGRAKGLLLSDEATAARAAAPALVELPSEIPGAGGLQAELAAVPNPSGGPVTVSFVLDQSDNYQVVLEDISGARRQVVKKGWAEAGLRQTFRLEDAGRPGGLYLLRLHTSKGSKTLKLMVSQ
ncbi:T9SS type A sorting domain-containing protein [Paraflavisolibacter sp. H34]|uniref:T9SS type A sorting domain-containing protein n=1 Tax=Huijunlia imazamoxiresistens TaxID=3127457 RepID=UPI003019A790